MSITDGTFICALCGESLTGCSLCGDAPLIDMRKKIADDHAKYLQGEKELEQQSKAIRLGAEIRRKYGSK